VRRLRREFLPSFQDCFLPKFEPYVRAGRETDLSKLSEEDVADLFERRLNHFLHESSPVLMTGSILGAMSYRDVEDLLIDRLGMEGVELTQQLLTGLKPNPTMEMHEAMTRVAHGDESESSFLARFGHRCRNEFELAEPRWRENPEPLRSQIARACGSSPESPEPRLAAEERLGGLERAWGRVRRDLLRSRFDTARRFFPLREQTKDYLMMEYELLRAPLVELGRRLGLDCGIFYLHCDEIRSAVAGEALHGIISARRREHELQQKLSLPQVILGSQLLREPRSLLYRDRERAGDATRVLTGIGVSRGLVRGPVRVLGSASDLRTVARGEILVARSLDPTWTTAYTHAAGLVAERGAILSHGAIVARELALPAVVNVADATSRLHNGEAVEVDGTRGEIRLLDSQTGR